jgi:hypothetical protein
MKRMCEYKAHLPPEMPPPRHADPSRTTVLWRDYDYVRSRSRFLEENRNFA